MFINCNFNVDSDSPSYNHSYYFSNIRSYLSDSFDKLEFIIAPLYNFNGLHNN